MSNVALGFTLARTKASIELAELSAITARRSRPERDLASSSRLGFACGPIDQLDRAGDEDLPGGPGLEKGVADAKGNFRLIHFNDSFEKVAVGIDHRAPQLLRHQPSRLVSDAELVFQLPCRHAVGMGRHHMRRPEPRYG